MTMTARAAHAVLTKHRTDEVVVTEMTAALLWPFVTKRQDLDLCLFDCMGKASSIGLGIALARPDRRVMVFDGDGSLLMNLGSLVTIAGMAPTNLIHFVFQNGQYEVTGGQPIPAVGTINFPQMALGAGFKQAYEFATTSELDQALPTILAASGPTFVCLNVESTERTLPIPDRLTAAAVAEVTATLAREQ